ncbi:MAG: 2-C-methyl-D-erythritol 4-phosphate cytidylyltransferase, partial [Dehalococcoidia bacterium]
GGGGPRDSVAAGIDAAPDAEWYLVHDGARPLLTPALVARVVQAARRTGAAVPGVPVVDTIKRVRRTPDSRTPDAESIEETVDRTALRAVQTPQAFRSDLLRRAHAEVTADATDDASMLEALGIPVALVEGDRANLKVTTPADLVLARALLAERLSPAPAPALEARATAPERGR